MSVSGTDGVVVIGGGHATAQLVSNLRQNGYAAPISIVCSEDHLPYQRPPLSKHYLTGKIGLDRVYLRQSKFYEDKEISCSTGKTVEEIDLQTESIRLRDGTKIHWDQLVIATGSRNRRLNLDGVDAEGVCSLRTISDSESIRNNLNKTRHLAIVGGGYIGLEVAASARSLGVEVTVIEVQERLLARVATPEVSQYFKELHETNGVKILHSTQVESIECDSKGEACAIKLGGDAAVECESILIGVGIQPNVELAQEAGLECNNGIVVDEYGRTEHEKVFAIGDCANQRNELLGQRLRLECVPNAMEQARCVAATLAGTPTPNYSVPWFWSDQYDVKFQIAGFPSEGGTVVHRSSPGKVDNIKIHINETEVVGATAINAPGDFLVLRKLMGKRIARDVLANAQTNLKDLV